MLQYFRINDPYRLIGLLVILVLLYLPTFWDSSILTIPELKSLIIGEKIRDGSVPFSSLVDSNGPISAWIFALVDLFFGRSLAARHVISFIILFSQSGFLGITFNDKKVFKESTYISSFLFSILTFFSFDTLALSSELLGCGFLLLALKNLIKEIEFRNQKDETIFNLGIYVSLASLCNFSFVIHLIGVITILAIFTRTSVRSYVLLTFGFLLPHFFMMSVYFTNGNLDSLWQYFYLPNLSFYSIQFITSSSLFWLSAIPLAFLFISIVMLTREARLTKYQSQLLQSMFFWMIFSFLQALFDKELKPQSFLAMIPSIAFFLTHFLLTMRRRRLAELNIWLLSIGVVTVSYMARYNKLKSVKYDKLIVNEVSEYKISNKKILVLGEGMTIFKQNSLATPFLDWNLSRQIFENPDYYENVIEVYDAFKQDPPDIIIDPNDLMKKFLVRIPELRSNYQHTAGVYTRVKSKNSNRISN